MALSPYGLAVREAESQAALATTDSSAPERIGVELYWLPLGAGGHFVRMNGRIYEAASARRARRPVCDLYHS